MPLNQKPLPIDDVLPQVLDELKSAGCLVLQAQPGAGKTTRIAPAILDAGLGSLPGQAAGQIILLQPRRIAARSAATRISEERGTELGGEVGYQVRFEKRASKNTRILVCTEGICLRRLQDDPLLEDVSVVIFDEFHERSIDSDLALAMVRQVRHELRHDLRIVVMSATLDTAPVSKYLGGCPVIASPGKLHPVTIEYLTPPARPPGIDKLVSDAVKSAISRDAGHVLAFLPGVGEIRQTEAALQETAESQNLALLTLYGDMPLEEQQRVLRYSQQRKIILATNVAETSITIDGVTSVVDSGMARVNRLDARLGLNRLELERISKASAEQRAGRAGRTAPGLCFRLWSEREQQQLRDTETPEIARVELSQCILQLYAWGESDVRAFPWFEPPPDNAVEQALLLLQRLDALVSGKLTDLGKRMAQLPLQPRLARLLLEGKELGQPKRAALCAALLSERDPIRRSSKAGEAQHHSNSDVLDRLSAIEEFAASGERFSEVGELLNGPGRQILRAQDQLLQLLKNDRDPSVSNAKGLADADTAVLRALLSSFPDRVCRRRDEKGRRALMVGGRGVRLADESAVGTAEFFIATEIMDTGKSESLVLQASEIDKSWLDPLQITSSVETAYDAPREKVIAFRRLRFCDLLIEENSVPLPKDIDCSQILAQAVRENFSLEALIDEDSQQYIARLQCLSIWLPELGLPTYDQSTKEKLLVDWCSDCSSIQELRNKSIIPILQSYLTPEQISALESEAPARITVPSGSRIKIQYEPEQPPVLAVRVQEVFGMRESPRIARSKIPVLMHLLAPNFRVQQITSDLAGFWKNTYADVKKDLRRRYPKHAWPDDPLTAQAEKRPQRKP